MRTVEDILEEITKLEGKDDKEAFKKFLEISKLGSDSGDKYVQVTGLMNAAAIACKMEGYDLCLKMLTDAQNMDEEIWTKYLQEEAHMSDMMRSLSNAGYLN